MAARTPERVGSREEEEAVGLGGRVEVGVVGGWVMVLNMLHYSSQLCKHQQAVS